MKRKCLAINPFQKECLVLQRPKPARGVSYNHASSKQTADKNNPLEVKPGRIGVNPQLKQTNITHLLTRIFNYPKMALKIWVKTLTINNFADAEISDEAKDIENVRLAIVIT